MQTNDAYIAALQCLKQECFPLKIPEQEPKWASEMMLVLCRHVFCDPCIRAAVKAQKKCPTCRKTMAMKAIHRVYLDRR